MNDRYQKRMDRTLLRLNRNTRADVRFGNRMIRKALVQTKLDDLQPMYYTEPEDTITVTMSISEFLDFMDLEGRVADLEEYAAEYSRYNSSYHRHNPVDAFLDRQQYEIQALNSSPMVKDAWQRYQEALCLAMDQREINQLRAVLWRDLRE